VVEVGVNVARDASGRWRHPARLHRAAPTSPPPHVTAALTPLGYTRVTGGAASLEAKGNGDRSGSAPLIIYGFGAAFGGILLAIAARVLQVPLYGPAWTHRGPRD
jgi:hypothetical protein